MSFEEWWDKEGKKVREASLNFVRVAEAAYRAGLLHAAEQDSEKAQTIDIPKFAVAYAESAESHRQAASEVK